MENITLFFSNHLENLVEDLALIIETPLSSIFDPEIILVQSKGMERWLSLELAKKKSLCANILFPFPNAFVDDCFQKVLGKFIEGQHLFDRQVLIWQIMEQIEILRNDPEFESIHHYLGEGENSLKMIQLSERITDLFDQYIIFRPDWIHSWDNEKEGHWQAKLWKGVKQKGNFIHRADLRLKFLEVIKNTQTVHEFFPDRISVFGISTLPQFHLDILRGISTIIPVYFFLLNPCQEYWGDIASNWELKKMTSTYGHLNLDDYHVETGNKLLASMGTLGRDFFDLLWENNWTEHAHFSEPVGDSLLANIQSDILNLRPKAARFAHGLKKRSVYETDYSIMIHSCHGPMREVEVLYDNILKMLNDNDELKPQNILVMTPDIDTYAPYFQAVFNVPFDDDKFIAFSIADQNQYKDNPTINTFLDIIELVDKRFTTVQVMAILKSESIMNKFNFTAPDLDIIFQWIDQTRIYWGRNSKDREKYCGFTIAENTWEAGLSRMLLGYAFSRETLFEGMAAFTDIEGANALVLGRLTQFLTGLFNFVASLGMPKTLSQWSSALKEMLHLFFFPDDTHTFGLVPHIEKDLNTIDQVLTNLSVLQTKSGFDKCIDHQTLKYHLIKEFETRGLSSGFITGGITFCAMLPMRSIPFEVVCLVGLNHDNYPRRTKTPGFDLMAERPRKGDRSSRNDDRYLFLEALLSARKQLYISYVGQDVRDNSELPPSVLVEEIKDYIEENFYGEKTDLFKKINVKHKLQAFNPAYFSSDIDAKEPGLFSFSKENLNTAKILLENRIKHPDPFFPCGISEPEKEWKNVWEEDLSRFFNNPITYLLQKRLGIILRDRKVILEEKEPFALNSLDQYFMVSELLNLRVIGHDIQKEFKVMKAHGRLPYMNIGKLAYEQVMEDTEKFYERLKPFLTDAELYPVNCSLSIADFKLEGQVQSIYPNWHLQYRPTQLKPKDYLSMWIKHLMLNCKKPGDYPLTSVLVGSDSIVLFSEIPASQEFLFELLQIYWTGLTKPIHFFAKASFAYAFSILKDERSPMEALAIARSIWDEEIKENPDYQKCFKDFDPLDNEFENYALKIFTPLFNAMKEQS